MKTIAQEDYLKNIYKLSQHSGTAATCDLAEILDVTPASVTNMLQKLAKTSPPLVNYQKHQGATLTNEGEKVALRVIRRHRLIELFLVENLNYGWDEVHEEAELLEHAVTPEFVEKVSRLLGDPKQSPHGQPIPTADLKVTRVDEQPLPTLSINQPATITRVRDEESKTLRYLAQHNLRPGTSIKIQKRLPDGTMHVLVQGVSHKPIQLTASMAQQIFVNKPLEGAELPRE